MASRSRTGVSILAGLALAALALSLAYTPESLPGLDLCLFRRVLDQPCPGCGLTRAFTAIGHGRFAEAWAFNPFGYVYYAAAVGVVVVAGAALRWPELPRRIATSRALGGAVLALFAAMVAFGVARLVHGGGA